MKSEEVDDYQPLSVKEALSLLSTLQSSQVIPVLRHPDFVMLAGLAFQGFRLDAGGYTNPIVRRRLAEEAAKNHLFADKLRALAKAPPPAPAAVAKPQGAAAVSSPERPPDVDSRRELEKYRAERDRLKQERDAAVNARQAAERALTEAKRDLIASQSARAEAERETERIKQRLERVERKQRQLETTNAALRRAAILPPPGPVQPITPAAPAAPTGASERHFAEAVKHLLKKDRASLALSLVNDVLRVAPDDVAALEIKAEALANTDKPREAAAPLRSALTLNIKYGHINRAAGNLYRLLLLSGQPAQETKLIRDFMSALQRSSDNPGKLAEPINALRTDNPEAFALVKSLTPPAILNLTFPEKTVFAADDPLPLVLATPGAVTVTARQLITAVDRNDQTIVELTQAALRTKGVEDRDKILASITLAADGDGVYARVLAPKFSRGAIVVDSSNVAWHGQEMVAHQQPRLEFVLAIRRTLREMGYFPVVLIADANLPYVINDASAVRKMVDDDQIHLVLGGSDADEQILREARRLRAPVLSNDYMVDWDPDQNVTKIQYSFTPDGRPTVYF